MRRVQLHTRRLVTVLFIIFTTFIYYIINNYEEENFILGESTSYVDLLFNNKSLNAYVVEEHHEVLQYWFEAARRKVLLDSGNTLIHVDGHSDMGLPFFFNEFPYFRGPTNRKDIYFLMQRNDIFIIAAAMTKLINRVVWIWPFWDKINHKSSYTKFNIDIGITSISHPIYNSHFKLFCICDRDMSTKVKICRRISLEREDVLEDTVMESSLCQIKRSIQFEEMNEYEALKRTVSRNLLLQNETVILDIDEDYFGCTYACKPLLDCNISLISMDLIDNALEKLICPKTPNEEAKADDMLGFVLYIISDCHKDMKRLGFASCSKEEKLQKATKLLDKFIWSSENNLGCSRRKGTLETGAMYDLLDIVTDFNYQQLMSLKRVGFCLTTALKSFQLTMKSVFHICKGNNDPGSATVFIHSPTMDEISLRMRNLNAIIKSIDINRKTQIVTICRSIRDGYTPRKYFKLIETGLFKSLQRCFKNKNIEFKFDNGLLGGVYGWTNKNRKTYKPTYKELFELF